jgi:hypothetical protein
MSLSPQGKIFTINGIKQICDINVDDVVLSHDSRLHKVIEKRRRPYNNFMVRIKARGCPVDYLTLDHYVFAAKDLRKKYVTITDNEVKESYSSHVKPKDAVGEIEEISVSRLSTDHYFVFPIPKNEEIGYSFVKYDPFFLKLGGYYLADGYVDRPNKRKIRRFGICLNKDMEYHIDKVKFIIKAMCENKICTYKKDDSILIRCNNTMLSEMLYETFGTGRKNKKIPADVVYGKKKNCMYLINAFFKKGYSFTTSSEQLAHSLSLIMRRCGYPQSFYKTSRDTYDIAIWKDINLAPFRIGDYMYHKIHNIKHISYKGTVYDISVDRSDSYVMPIGTVLN